MRRATLGPRAFWTGRMYRSFPPPSQHPNRAGWHHGPFAPALVALVAAGVTGALQPLHAQSVRLQPTVEAAAMATDNSGLKERALAEPDLLLRVSGILGAQVRGSRTTFDGRLRVDAVGSVNGTQPWRLLPSAQAALSVNAIDRWLVVNSNLDVAQESADPFAPAPDAPSSINKVTVRRLGFVPVLDHRFGPRLAATGRLSNEWISRSGANLPVAVRRKEHAQDYALRLAYDPEPVGWWIDGTAQRSGEDFAGSVALDSRWLRAGVEYNWGNELRLGLSAGREAAKFSVIDRAYTTRGVSIAYTPSERTKVELQADRRFFGIGWDLSMRHRTPFLALNARLVSRPVGSTTGRTLGPTSSVAALLDAMLTTRQPDPALRAPLVRSTMDRLALPESLDQPLELVVDSASLERGGEFALVGMGRVTTVTLSTYYREYEPLTFVGEVLPAGPLDARRSRLNGGSLIVSRRLNPNTTIEGYMASDLLRSIGATLTDRSRGSTVRLTWRQRLTPNTVGSIGAQHQRFDSTTSAVDTNANSIQVTLSHNF